MSHQDALSRRRYALVPCTCSEEEVKEGSYEALGGMAGSLGGWMDSLRPPTTLFPSRRIECSVGPGDNFGSDRHAV